MYLHVFDSVHHTVYIIVLLHCTIVPRSTCATSVAAPSNATNATNSVLLSETPIPF